MRKKNLRVERTMRRSLGEALALALFRVTEGRKETPEERAEIIPAHHTSTRRAHVRVEVNIDLSFLE